METMRAAYMLKDSSSLSIRRSVLVAFFSSFESWLNIKKREKECPSMSYSSISYRSQGILDTLNDISGSKSKGDCSISEKEEYSLVAAVVDWSIASLKSDPDENCRVLKSELIRLGIEGFGLLQGQNIDD